MSIPQLHQDPLQSSTKGESVQPRRRSLLAVFLVVGFFTGSFLFNWPPVQVLYIRSGAYSWLCDATEETYSLFDGNSTDATPAAFVSEKPDILQASQKQADATQTDASLASERQSTEAICDAQLQAIDSLMPIGVASMFVFSFIGGNLVDFFGPRFSAFTGVSLLAAGWTLLGFCNEKLPMYPLANVLLGFGSDPVYFALLNIANLFPEHYGLVMTIVSASRTLSLALPSGFNMLLHSYPASINFSIICFAFALVQILCITLVLFTFPSLQFSRLPSKQPSNASPSPASPGAELLNSWIRNSKFQKSKYADFSSASLPTAAGSQKGTEFSFFSTSSQGSAYSLSKGFRPSRVLVDSTPDPSLFTNMSLASSKDLSAPLEDRRPKWTISAVVNSGQYLPLLPIAATTILSATFFANTSREQLGSAWPLMECLNPLSFISGLLLGVLVDMYGPLPVMVLVNALGMLQFVLLLLSTLLPFLSFAAAFVSFFIASFFLAQFYSFIGLTFPGMHFGALSGFVVMGSGLLSLVVTPMCDFSSFAANFTSMNALCTVLTAGNFVFLWLMWHAQPAEEASSASCQINRNSNDGARRARNGRHQRDISSSSQQDSSQQEKPKFETLDLEHARLQGLREHDHENSEFMEVDVEATAPSTPTGSHTSSNVHSSNVCSSSLNLNSSFNSSSNSTLDVRVEVAVPVQA